jgi:hypothetical protein
MWDTLAGNSITYLKLLIYLILLMCSGNLFVTASSAKAQRMRMETACSDTDYTFPVSFKMPGERLST